MNSAYIGKIIDYEISSISPILFEWFSKNELEDSVSEVVGKFFKNNFSKENSEVFLKNKYFPDACEEDFKTCIIELGNGRFAVTVIDLEEDYRKIKAPVIELIFKNFNMSDLEPEEFKKITDRYKMFRPDMIRYCESNKNNGAEKKFGEVPENITIAGIINSVKHLPKNENHEKVKIEQIDSMDFYTVYSDEYDLFFESNEAMKNKIEKETFVTLENILKYGKLYKAIIDNEFAGVFAIVKNMHLYFKNYFIREEILFKKFRGKGYASVFQRKVIESLPADEIKIISGMIHAENKLSMRTAMRCGRSAIETNFLIKLKY